jgi:signal transduction histidine kinase/DNA-binding response OmpR family regulator
MIGNAIKRSVSRKFMLAVLATTLAALVVSAAAMLAYDIEVFRSSWVNDLRTQSDILAQISLPALEFNDTKVARENLEQMKARPNILQAAIYGPDKALFAMYASGGAPSGGAPAGGGAATATTADVSAHGLPPVAQAEGYRITSNEIRLFREIRRNGETVGTVYLHAKYPLADRIQRYVSILALVMSGCLGLAILVSFWLQRAITTPIVAVTGVVHQVIRKRDFSLRVKKSTDDEIGVFVDAFNIMLTEVGERAQALESSNAALQHEMKERVGAEEALRELNATLEERILLRSAELERLNDQLRQSQKLEAIGQLTGGVAHDFNNVLQVISGNLQLLHLNVGADQAALKRLQTAAFAADRGAKLSSQLLAFARRQPLKPVATSLGRILRNMDDLLRRALGESVQVETVVTGGLWTAMVDPNQLENVILNLAINARDAMNGEGNLTLEIGNAMLDDHYIGDKLDIPAGQYVMLAISDTGGGMPEEVLARAFEPFFTTKREGEGTGLGLSMAYGFVKQSQGHIKIYSELGSGTTIKIYLPRSQLPEAAMPETLTGPAIGGAETILVVEDDMAVQATTVDMLSGLGYRILKANDGQSALTILESGVSIDMLFTDVVMPGPLRSPDLARQAKLLFPDIEVLFTSGYTQNAIVHGGRLDPGVELISKPYRREDLARRIRHMLNNRAQSIGARKPAFKSYEPEATPATEATLRILVVEDNEDSQVMLCELLMILGHHARGVGDAGNALEALGDSGYDVLLTDLNLPDMSGLELARKAVAGSPTMKIIFSSGYGAVSADEFGHPCVSLPKPYDLDKLQQVLDSLATAG